MATRPFNVSAREPIRVLFDMTPILVAGVDRNTCQTTGNFANGYRCRSEDVVFGNSDRVGVISQTLEAVQSYIQGLVAVTPYDRGTDTYLTDPLFGFGEDHLELDVFRGTSQFLNQWPRPVIDLYIVVVARPQDPSSSTLATASGRAANKDHADEGRPIAGFITINGAKLPGKAQTATSGQRQFFVTIVHELMHVLAFSHSLFNTWRNRWATDSHFGEQYSAPLRTYTNSYGLQQQFITTPKLVDWVKDRFQVVNTDLLQLGLELEDGGGTGTAGSHPNSRLYFTDVMQGKTYGPGYISGIFSSSLWDSGWYDVPENGTLLIEELVYMDAALHGTSPPNQNALIQPAQLTFPPDYLCSDKAEFACFYDYSAKGVCSVMTPDELMEKDSTATDDFTSNSSGWYNPRGDKVVGTEQLVDYAPIFLPSNANCRDPDAPSTHEDVANLQDKLHEVYSADSVCAMSTIFNGNFGEVVFDAIPACFRARCGTDNKLRMTLDDDREQLCTRTGRKIYSKKHVGHVKCPPAKEACATHSKFEVIPITQAIPDRGPYDGQNFILLKGQGLDKYTELTIQIGDVNLDILARDDTRILVEFPKLDKKDEAMKLQHLYAVDPNFPQVNGTIENFYMFTERAYDAAWTMAVPAMALVMMSALIAFII